MDQQDVMIPVRVTDYSHDPDEEAELTAELAEAMKRGGLILAGLRWFATQTELDTPHTTFRIDAR
jgi:hypothetical protein